MPQNRKNRKRKAPAYQLSETMNASVEPLPSETLLRRCADNWRLRNLVFIRKMENIVYACDSPSGKVFLRLTTPLRRTRPEIEAEVNWIEHLSKWGLKVPHLILDRTGNKIASFSEGKQHYEAVVFGAIAGNHPSKERVADSKFLNTLGALIANMHLASEKYESSHQGMKREEWFEERGLRHALTAAESSRESTLRAKLQDAIAWMQKLPKTKENYGLVHADLGALNLLIEEDSSSIGIIDFDDSCYHWFVFDLAIVVFSMASRFEHATALPEEERWLADLVAGYRTVRPLSDAEIRLVKPFIDFACLRLFFWIEYHEKLHTFHDEAIDKITKIKAWTRRRVL
jgi:Ser/Thr protein kinase RdoA (MazF antagonist)